MVTEIVTDRGQVTIPEEVRRAAGIAEGDSVVFSVVGPGQVQMTMLRPMSISEFVETFPLDETVAGRDWADVRDELEHEQAALLFSRTRRGTE
jgi:AbrB family looped-hinge helix DNA binding protein